MILRRALLMLMALLALAAVAQAVYWAPRLPERVASHFDMDNQVNGWMGRTGFLVLSLGVEALMIGLFFALPFLLEKLPDALINLPHKDYWLAPSRRAESLAQMSSGLLVIGCATLLLLLVLFQGIFALNAEIRRDGASSPVQIELPVPFFAVMGVYLGVMAVVLVWMMRRFRRPAGT